MLLGRRLLEGVIEFESNATPCDKPTRSLASVLPGKKKQDYFFCSSGAT